MKKLLSKISMFLSVLLVSTSFLGGMSTFASTKVTGMNDLETKYNLRTIALKDIPKNITPIKFDTTEEADTFLAEQKAKPKVINLTEITDVMYPAMAGYQTKVAINMGYIKYNVSVSYGYNYISNKFVDVGSVSGYLTGVTLGNGYTQQSYSSSITNGGSILNVKSFGTHDMYLIVSGVGHVASEHMTLAATFYPLAR